MPVYGVFHIEKLKCSNVPKKKFFQKIFSSKNANTKIAIFPQKLTKIHTLEIHTNKFGLKMYHNKG